MGEGLDFAVRYPFTSTAKELLKSDGFSNITDEVVELAITRIIDSLSGKTKKRVYAGSTGKREDLLAYATARVILGYMRNRYITNKFAVSESKIVHSYLNEETDDVIDRVAGELGIKTMADEGVIFVPLPVFLKFTPRSPHYHLINRHIMNGLVLIEKQEKKRMIEEAVRKHLERVPLVKRPPQGIVKAARRIMEELPKKEIQATAGLEDDHPPCIAELMDAVRKHQNLSHQARFYLAVYLIGIGLSDEKILRFFSNFPDFSEKITRYQVEHARKRGYSVPSCSTVVSYGLCRANCRIGNPLNWHRGRKK
jgi:DNA primase large subunit